MVQYNSILDIFCLCVMFNECDFIQGVVIVGVFGVGGDFGFTWFV